MTPRPEWWNEYHGRALAALSGEWAEVRGLMETAAVPFAAFDDLVVANRAFVRRTPIVKNGIAAGENVSFRLVNYWLDHCPSCGAYQPFINEELCTKCLEREGLA